MADPAVRVPPAAGPGGPDAVLATKLHLPSARPGFVPRPRLLERLNGAPPGELTLVCAPAGFGKTALLADWARGSPRRVAWLSLDAGDNDPARFWRHVAAALDRVRTGIGGQLAALLDPPPRSFEAVVTALLNELAAGSEQVVLVLDDYHLIEAAAVHDSVGLLLSHLPAELHLVLASRSDPPLALARLRGGGQLTELRAADLRFTAEEAAAVLRSATGASLPEAAVAALTARTEGWAAGLQLAALSLQAHADPAGFVATFSGSHRYVLDYLTEEVLARQPEQLVSFLLETSVLERLSGPLCDAVTGRGDGQQLLEAIERANLFLVPLDEVRGWWRYHQLFADLLRVRLQQQLPHRVPELHRAAAAWHEDHGLADDAVRHAVAAGDPAWAVRLVDRNVEALLQRGEGATLQGWLAALPHELVCTRPRLCLAQAVTALIGGRLDDAEVLLTQAERAHDAAGPPEPPADGPPRGLANVPGMLAMLRAELAHRRGDADRTIQLARQGLAVVDEDDRYLRYLLGWNLAMGTLLQGRVGDAEAALGELAADPWAAGQHRYFAVRAHYVLAQVDRAQGRLDAALRRCQRALELASGAAARPAVMVGVAHVGLAEVLREQGELDAALRHATEGVALCRQLAYGQWLGSALAILAWVRQAAGDPAGALAAIGEAEQAVPSQEAVADLVFPVAVQRARLLLAHGDVAAAARWARRRGLGAGDEPTYAREREYLVLARVLLAERAPERASGLLARLHDLAAAQGRAGGVIEVRALQALALDAAGDGQGALEALTEALALAAPEGWLRVFVDEGAPMAVLLSRLAAARHPALTAPDGGVLSDHLRRLRAAFGPAGTPRTTPAGRAATVTVPGMVEPLTERELDVLVLLAAGASNRQIADELVVAVETVKKHVSHILDKLGAANRTQAVARARQLGLLGEERQGALPPPR
ncbi:MAG TPA: LuxR C-terminal-related transcriptional regulator [Actinomycetes bacterium]|nr:LuxR C-terminal-related transcriptional regulator [Actinomycetes bacterium]